MTIGLPVYNGERMLGEAIASLLAQTFGDFELVISDNASTDGTEDICREFAREDPRVRYERASVNRGSAWNHNHLVDEARSPYFKWAAHDDIYDPDLLRRCVEVLDADPGVVLCHALVDDIDIAGSVIHKHDYAFRSDDQRPSVRYRDLLMLPGGHDLYGVARTDVMRATPPIGSFHHYSERPKISSMALHGRFHQVPDYLFHHREYDTSVQRIYTSSTAIAPVYDPRRGNRLLHPAIRLHVEYVGTFVRGIRTAPLTSAERARTYQILCEWLVHRSAQAVSRVRGRG